MSLNHYEGSNVFSETLDMQSHLMQLRPISDPYIAKTIDEYSHQVESYPFGSPKHEETGSYHNSAFYLINSLLDSANHSREKLSPILETSINNHISWIEGTYGDADKRPSLLLLRYAL